MEDLVYYFLESKPNDSTHKDPLIVKPNLYLFDIKFYNFFYNLIYIQFSPNKALPSLTYLTVPLSSLLSLLFLFSFSSFILLLFHLLSIPLLSLMYLSISSLSLTLLSLFSS